MKSMKTVLAFAIALVLGLTLSSCKKAEKTGDNASGEEMIIKLPPGLIHVGAQWVEGKVWVESFDPKTNSCLIRQYDAEGKPVEGAIKVRLRACRFDLPPAPAEAAAPAPAAANKPVAKPKPVAQKKPQ